MAMHSHSPLKPLMLFICLSFCFGTGCSLSGRIGSDSDDDGNVSGKMTGFSSNEELESYLKSQYLRSVYTDYPVALESRTAGGTGALDEAGNVPESLLNAFAPENSDGYTGTNLQEAGVDESDLVKTDGEYFYIASNDVLNIVRAADPLSVVGRISLEAPINSMYLYNDLLILLYSPAGYGGSPWIDPGMPGIGAIGIPYWIPIRSKVGIAFFDVSDPSAPNELKRVEADGYLVSSRRIDNHLYVVQQFLPDLPAPNELETGIRNMELDELIPFYTETGGAQGDAQPSQVVAAADFYHPKIDGGGSIISIMAFDLNDPDFSFSSTGAVADASIVYATTEALYFTSTYWNYSERGPESPREQTVAYKFKLEGGRVTGQGYASVDGRALNQFSLGEYEGVLRIATTTGWSGATDADSMNHVFCLRSVNGTLKVIGRLEDLAPGEEIYAARFIGPRGYLVTFVTIDPLFTLDLSDPTAPEVAGELKIPGYSAYIHPYGDNYLLCIGKDAVEDNGFAWYQGVQLTIFDVGDISNPVQLHKAVIGDRGTSSDALYNHKAFTFWETNSLLAIPIELYEHQSPPAYPYSFGDFTFGGLYVYRVGTTGGFEFIGRISTMPDAPESGYYHSPWTRGIFVGDNVYAVTPDSVNSAQINDIEGTVQRLILEGD
jgi:inhibitor of cysteine peptidase